MSSGPSGKVLCRQITGPDLPAVVDLLRVGFPSRTRAYWNDGLTRWAAHQTPAGFPDYGHMLESDGRAVGVVLLLAAALPGVEATQIRGNISSWYVRPEFRSYGGLLVLRAIRQKQATYLNISPAVDTWPVIEAQGFHRYNSGSFAALPALSPAARNARAVWVPGRLGLPDAIPPADLQLMMDHHAFGCLCLWYESDDGGQPFIFRRRFVGRLRIPCAQLIYCRSLSGSSKWCGAIGRALALRGMPVLLIPADKPPAGVAGRLFGNRQPMYYKGITRPMPGDLSYTEAAVFGI